MKKILFLLSRYPGIGGIERITTLLANELVPRYGIIICSHVQEMEDQLLSELDSRVRFVCLPCVADDIANLTFLKDVITYQQVDIVVYQDSYFHNEQLPIALSNETSVKLVVVEHNSPNNPNLSLFAYFHDNAWCRNVYTTCKALFFYCLSVMRSKKRRTALYRASDRYVLLSDSLKQHFYQHSHVSDSLKLEVIANPVSYHDIGDYKSGKQKQVLLVAQLIKRKGIMRLLRMWKTLESQNPDWKLTIVGDGELMQSAQEYIRNNELKHVEMPGFVSPATPYYETAQIYCLCSSFEGYPMVLPEAMTSGVIPVAFDSFPALRDIVEDGVTGFIIPAFNEAAFAKKLSMLMNDEQLCARMRSEAVRKSREFEIAPVVKQWVQLFESL